MAEKSRYFIIVLVLLFCGLFRPSLSSAEEVDKTLQPTPVETDEIEDVYRDMVVVQRKAKNKAKHRLLNIYESFDFSDGPTTMYGLNIDAGYAFSDFWEAYVNVVPVFITQERDVVKQVASYNFVDGSKAQVKYSKPKSALGAELLWLPAYGKDSWGPRSIVRSDTFFKFGIGLIQYDGDNGKKLSLSLGKTFFIKSLVNFRISAGGSYVESIIEGQKRFYFAGIFELGLVWYL